MGQWFLGFPGDRCHRNVDPETVLPRTGLIRGTPEKPSAHFTTAKTYVGTYIITDLFVYIGKEKIQN